MHKFKVMMNMFFVITTCVLTAVALFTNILFPVQEVEPVIFWQILATCFLCALSTLVYQFEKMPFVLTVFLHYLMINAIVLGFGHLFEWYDVTDWKSVIAMVVMIALIYALVVLCSWKGLVREAEKMNRKLQDLQKQR